MDTKRCIRCKGEIAEYYPTCPLCGEEPHEPYRELGVLEKVRKMTRLGR